jgi:4a-hydroxytetrahydrobiopterin dehydratase
VNQALGPLGTVATIKLGIVELLSEGEIDSRLAELDGWEREGEAIVKTFELADFVGSVGFIDRVVAPAEEMGHHPDLSVSWNKVRVSITTHAAGGLTANDFALANRIDEVAAGE